MKDNLLKDTFAYRSVFKYPLSFYQLGTFLVGNSFVEHALLQELLDDGLRDGTISFDGRCYSLSGVEVTDSFLRGRHAEKTIKDFRGIFKILGKIPWIKLLAVTGSFAAFNPVEDDDIDVFIISQRKRLWITRFFVVLLLKALGKYRSDKNPVSKICPNIYMSEEELSWDENKRNLYIAHEIAMMHPIINRDDTYFKFLKANEWLFDYFSNFEIHFPEEFTDFKEKPSFILDRLEDWFRTFQIRYMAKRKTTEVVTPVLIHFNRGDGTTKILDAYMGML